MFYDRDPLPQDSAREQQPSNRGHDEIYVMLASNIPYDCMSAGFVLRAAPCLLACRALLDQRLEKESINRFDFGIRVPL